MERDIRDQVKEYYGKVLASSGDLKTDAACCATEAPPKYVLDVMPLIADEVLERFFGCGSPIPVALEGATVVDLGCGSGRDVYVLSKLVGEAGRVIGIDMTAEQLAVARKFREYQAGRFGFSRSNVELLQGYIEDLEALGIPDESVDVVVSNCVINLSPFKDQVFSEIYRILKPGGELYFSDVFASRRLPEALQHDPAIRGECLGGALYWEDFLSMMRRHGWPQVKVCSSNDISIGDFALQTKLGFIGFASRTVRAIKASALEETEEDYGQYLTYRGTISETSRYFDFDEDMRFIKGKPHAVSGNTASLIAQSRYGMHFEITDRKAHRGRFRPEQAGLSLDLKLRRRMVDLRLLDETCEKRGIRPFAKRVGEDSLLQASAAPKTMQVNICYACNLSCRHCYLECGPHRNERMAPQTMAHCLEAFATQSFETLDITGGSPELHEDFAWFLREGAALGKVIARSNLTLLDEPAYRPLEELFAETETHIVASLPFYNSAGTDAQRGSKAFEKTIRSIRRLNALGYGKDPRLTLDLVYNVSGPFLPPPQDLLQEAYAQVLSEEQGIVFDSLLAFNNFPLGRFAAALADAGMLEDYLELLADSFNALAVTRMMCHDQVNVDVDGRLYDCECNHVLGLPIKGEGRDATIADIMDAPLAARPILISPVCYSCAAGSGSSCGGSLL